MRIGITWVLIASAVLGCSKGASVSGSGSGSGSSGSSGSAISDKPTVAVSIFPIYDLTRRIAGDRLNVTLLLPPGKSEHGYTLDPNESAALANAKLVVVVGFGLDTWAEPAGGQAKLVRLGDKVTMPMPISKPFMQLQQIVPKKIKVKDIVQPVKIEKTEVGSDVPAPVDATSPPAFGEIGAPDPHFWLDPDRMNALVDHIAEELAALDPAGKATFERNAWAVTTALTELDHAIQARATGWIGRKLITFHHAMPYYADHYNLRIAAVVEEVPGTAPSPEHVTRVLGAIGADKVPVFAEPQLDRAPAEALAKQAGVTLGELDPLGGSPGRDTYEKWLLWNTDQIEKVMK